MHFKFVFCLNIKSNKIVSRCIEVCFALFLWCWGWNPGFCSCHESTLPAACSPAPLARILSHHPHRNIEQSCHPQTPYHDPFVVNPTHSLSREPTNLFFIPICRLRNITKEWCGMQFGAWQLSCQLTVL